MTVARRRFLEGTLYTLAAGSLLPRISFAQAEGLRQIPSSGEKIPAVGLGTWITFNVGEDPVLRNENFAVMKAFFAAGGGMIDSSPMYGSAQSVIGEGLKRLGRDAVFSTDKVWTSSGGPAQIERTRALWGIPKFDLLQVHNLVAWQENLETLFAMKAEGKLRYAGITTSHGRRHGLFEEIMKSQPLDFVQLTYNIADREVEARLLPLARERGIAVIVNRPFQRGSLTGRLERKPLPGWAPEIGAKTWAQVLLKFILAHPAVTVAIPATSQVEHVLENKAAALGPLPDAALRKRMLDDVQALI